GVSGPSPRVRMRSGATPRSTMYAFTDSARLADRLRLNSRLPTLSVWPTIMTLSEGYWFRMPEASSSVGLEMLRMVALPLSNSMPLITPVNFLTTAGISSGQPSSSSKPFLVSGSFGHLSLESMKPSPSLSGGQPSGATPGTSMHLSSRSSTPSLSPSGQPVGATPGTSLHSSLSSSTPSASASRIGQPSGAIPASCGHLSLASGKPSLSASRIGHPSGNRPGSSGH